MAQQKIILNADPDLLRRRARSQVLRTASFHVVEAESARQAIAALTSRLPAVVVLSTCLAGYPDLYRYLKNDPTTVHIPVLLLGTETLRDNQLTNDTDCYLAESIADEELLAYVWTLLRLAECEHVQVQREQENRNTLNQELQAQRAALQVSEQTLRDAPFEPGPVDAQAVRRKQQRLRKMSLAANGAVAFFAALTLLIALPTLLEYLAGINLGIADRLIAVPADAALNPFLMFIFVALIWWTTVSLDRADTQRRRNARVSAQLASIVASSSDAILSYTLDGRITSWNLGAERMFGYTAEEMIGQPIRRLFPPEQHTEAEHILMRQRAGENIQHYETVQVSKEGHRLNVWLTISPIKNSMGTIIGVSEIMRDITECKRTEEQGVHSQKIFHDLIEGAPFGIYVVDSQLRIAQMNAGAQNGAFRNVRPVIGRDFAEAIRILWPEPVAAQIMASFRHTLETGEPYYSPHFTNPRHDIEAVEFYEWELHRITLSDGQYGVVCYYFDSTQLRQVEEALRQSREDLDRAQSVGQIGWWRLDVRRNVLTWSDESYRIFGVTQGTPLTYEVFLEIVHPDDRSYVDSQWKEAVHQRAPYDIEHRIVVDGQVKWVREKAYLEFDAAGHLRGGFGITQNITERKQVEEALRESQERFRGIVESAMDAIIAIDAEQRIVLFNAAAEAMFHCSRNEALGTSIDRFIPERFREAHRTHIRRFGECGTTARAMGHLGAISGLRADGEEFPIEASISQITLGQERIFTVILRDITERKRAENALYESEQRFANFMRRLPGLAWIKDIQGRYVYINEAAENVFRFPRAELYGKTDVEIFPYETAEQFRKNDQEALASETGLVTIETLEHSDGILHHSLVSKFPMLDSNGLVKGTGGVAIDITEHMQAVRQLQDATEKLREADRRKDEFLATLAHELRNPLAPIRNGLHVLRQAGSDGPVAERVLPMMERQMNHLVRLVDDLLEVSRISRGKIELKKERSDLVVILRHALDTSQPAIQAGNHQLTITLPSEPVWLNVDPVRITQVFTNLLNNAAKFTEAGGYIDLTAELRDCEAIVSVRDSGIGIPAEMLPHVFDLFTQVKRKLGRSQDGLGIGLSLARSLIGMHGGRIDVHSEGIGQGSEFVVHLPLAILAAADTEETAAPTPAIQAAQRILVTDDNQDAADSLAILLRSLGHDVQVTYNGPAALELLVTFKPNVVVLDIGMPDMDGYEVARRIRQHSDGKNVLLIALTGWGQNEDRRRTREAGFDHHLVKPASIETLQTLLASLNSRHQDV